MTENGDPRATASRFLSRIEESLELYPRSGEGFGIARAPAVVDVMGGIGEDSGALVLTTTAALAFHVAAWPTGGDQIRIRFYSDSSDDPRDFAVPLSAFTPSGVDGGELPATCRSANADWAAPSLLVLHRAWAQGALPRPDAGLCLVLATDFPGGTDMGRDSVQAAATIDAVFKMFGRDADRLSQSRISGEAIAEWTGLYHLRQAMTALCGPADGAILQLRFHPNLLCERLEMPDGVIVKAVATRLSRPTTLRRLIETRLCSEMGHRMIMELQKQDGLRLDPGTARLSSITPSEYVERYRDRMPSKITREAFVTTFGTLRGLDDHVNPRGGYKIRSRAEHHIYENRRVHDFATLVARARRNRDLGALRSAGELMYASHWSHSQRCGIGGVETDRLATFIRRHGPEAGLFGAKVTGGGEGGEQVVLMRDDERAHAALADAVEQAEAASQHKVQVFSGALPGAEFFEAPNLPELMGSPGAV